jgi:hypothetical protein
MLPVTLLQVKQPFIAIIIKASQPRSDKAAEPYPSLLFQQYDKLNCCGLSQVDVEADCREVEE